MAIGIDPKVDYAFKKLFGSEAAAPLLIDLLHAVLKPPACKAISGVEFLDPHSERDAPDDKLTVGDVRARDQGGRQFQVEMQWLAGEELRKWALHYWAKFHPQQLRAGEEYMTLRPTVAVYFLNQTIYTGIAAHHLTFRLLEQAHGVGFVDDLEIHWIELPKFTKTAEQVSDALDRWCYFLRHGEGLDAASLPATLDVPAIRRAMEVLTVFTREDHERARYEARQKAQLDWDSAMAWAKRWGELIGQINFCQKLLKQPITPKEGFSKELDQLEEMLERLTEQLTAGGNGA